MMFPLDTDDLFLVCPILTDLVVKVQGTGRDEVRVPVSQVVNYVQLSRTFNCQQEFLSSYSCYH